MQKEGCISCGIKGALIQNSGSAICDFEKLTAACKDEFFLVHDKRRSAVYIFAFHDDNPLLPVPTGYFNFWKVQTAAEITEAIDSPVFLSEHSDLRKVCSGAKALPLVVYPARKSGPQDAGGFVSRP